jgi:hypothetical protein
MYIYLEMGADTDLKIGRGRDPQEPGIVTGIEIETRTGMDQTIMTGYKILDAPSTIKLRNDHLDSQCNEL